MVVTVNGVQSNTVSFTVLPSPVMSTLATSSRVAGSLLTINGQILDQRKARARWFSVSTAAPLRLATRAAA